MGGSGTSDPGSGRLALPIPPTSIWRRWHGSGSEGRSCTALQGTFTDADADGGTTARITVTAVADAWEANAGTSAPETGTYTLVLTRVTSVKVLAEGEIYAVNGTLDATLPPVPRTSATGNVTLHAAF